MEKNIYFLTLRPGVEAERVLEALPDLGERVLTRVWITALTPPSVFPDKQNNPLQAVQEFMFETSGESTDDNLTFVSSQLFKLLVSELHLGQMRSVQSISIGVRRSYSGQGRGTVEILGR